MLRTRQICVSPKIVGLKGNSPKFDWVLDFMSDYPNKQVIIFTKFVDGINILHNLLSEKKENGQVITGSTPTKLRAEYVEAFQQHKYRYLILQIDACKEVLDSLNLYIPIGPIKSTILSFLYPYKHSP